MSLISSLKLAKLQQWMNADSSSNAAFDPSYLILMVSMYMTEEFWLCH
jgi:hypothetical protein